MADQPTSVDRQLPIDDMLVTSPPTTNCSCCSAKGRPTTHRPCPCPWPRTSRPCLCPCTSPTNPPNRRPCPCPSNCRLPCPSSLRLPCPSSPRLPCPSSHRQTTIRPIRPIRLPICRLPIWICRLPISICRPSTCRCPCRCCGTTPIPMFPWPGKRRVLIKATIYTLHSTLHGSPQLLYTLHCAAHLNELLCDNRNCDMRRTLAIHTA